MLGDRVRGAAAQVAVAALTGGGIDLGVLMTSVFVVAGAAKVVLKRKLPAPPWFNLAWWASDVRLVRGGCGSSAETSAGAYPPCSAPARARPRAAEMRQRLTPLVDAVEREAFVPPLALQLEDGPPALAPWHPYCLAAA